MPRFRRPAHVVSGNQWNLRARLSTLHPSDRPASSGPPCEVPRATSTARATRERCTNHRPAWRADRRSLFLRWLGLSPSPTVSLATFPFESPRWVFPDLRNDPRWYVAHVTDAVCRPTHWSWRWSPRRQCGSGQRSRLESAPRRDDFGLLRGAFGCWYRARHCRERGCPTRSRRLPSG